ncbi:MAG: glycosyltransferase family 4 protein [Ignavibacteriaceae bacterium]
MMNVLLMIDEASLGGGQKHVLWLAQNIDKRKFRVSVACDKSGWLVDELGKENIKNYPISITNKPNLLSLIRIRRLIKSLRPLIIHTHGGTAGFYGRLGAMFLKDCRTIHTYHGIHYLNDKITIKKSVFRIIDKLFLSLTDRIICVAKSDFDSGVKAGVVIPEKTEVIYNGIEIEAYTGGEKKGDSIEVILSGEKEGEIIIGSIGRLHVQKGYSFLIEAAYELIKKYSYLRFHIVGDGELRSDLDSKIRKYGLEDKFVLLGSREDVIDEVAKMDIFVLPSLWEGLPIVLLEAMAARKPIVATNVNGNKEILSDGETALLVNPGNAEEIVNKIDEILTDSALRGKLVENAFARVNEVFSLHNWIVKTERQYEALWENKENA